MSGTQNVPRREFLVRWRIKKLSLFGVKENQQIESQTFRVPFLENSQWSLKLISKEPAENTIRCYLYRKDTGPAYINVYYSISVGSTFTVELVSFRRNSLCGRPGLINRFKFNDDVRRNQSKDVLVVECRMWPDDTRTPIPIPASPYPVGTEMVTTIPNETESLFYEIPDFSSLPEGSEVEFSVSSAVCNPVLKLVCRMWMEQQTLKFSVRESSGLDFPFVLRCKMHLVDAFKDRHLLCNGQTIFNYGEIPLTNSITFSLFLSKKDLLDNKDLYLPDDRLLLYLEFVFSNNSGITTSVDCTLYDEPPGLHKNHELKWGLYLNRKFNEHLLIVRILALLVVVLSVLPHFWFDNTP